MTPEQSDRWLLLKRGLYWRPNRSGYTGLKEAAGRYAKDEATALCDDEVTGVHEDAAGDYSPKCPTHVWTAHIEKTNATLLAEVARLTTGAKDMTREQQIDWGAASLFAHDRDICEFAYLQGETWETFGKSYPKRKAEYLHKSERFLATLTAAGMVILTPETVAFLDGSAPIDGKWFGDIDDQEQARSPKRKYWWRKYLRAMTEAANG